MHNPAQSSSALVANKAGSCLCAQPGAQRHCSREQHQDGRRFGCRNSIGRDQVTPDRVKRNAAGVGSGRVSQALEAIPGADSDGSYRLDGGICRYQNCRWAAPDILKHPVGEGRLSWTIGSRIRTIEAGSHCWRGHGKSQGKREEQSASLYRHAIDSLVESIGKRCCANV
jgi:hypothetical protein